MLEEAEVITEKYLRVKDIETMNNFQRLIVDAKLSCGAWKAYRYNYILRDGKPILISSLWFMK